MDTTGTCRCLACTADAALADRLRSLGRAVGFGEVVWLSDPAALDLAAPQPMMPNPSAALVPDLTTPHDDGGAWRESERSAWLIAAMLALARGATAMPVVVRTRFDPLSGALERLGLHLAGQVAPDADDGAWRVALGIALRDLVRRGLAMSEAPAMPADRMQEPVAPLGTGITWNQETQTLAQGASSIALTRREAEILAALESVMNSTAGRERMEYAYTPSLSCRGQRRRMGVWCARREPAVGAGAAPQIRPA